MKPTLTGSNLIHLFAHRRTRTAALALGVVALTLFSFGLGLITNEQPIEKQDIEIQEESNSNSEFGKTKDVEDQASTNDSLNSLNAELLAEIINIISSDFVDSAFIDEKLLRDAAIAGILAALNDPHTSYITQEEVELGNLDIGFYEGIGATVGGNESGVIQIGIPFRDSPAEHAGIRPGDLIIEVDGMPTEGWSVAKAVSAIRGASGTEVILTVVHTDGTDPRKEEISVTRGGIQVPSVSPVPLYEIFKNSSGAKLVDREHTDVNDIAYIHIQQFTATTLNEISALLDNLELQTEYIGLIVDIRSNPGGYVTSTLEVTDQFLNEGTILIERRAGQSDQIYSAMPGGKYTDIAIVIVQDGLSASGAEVFASALVDNHRATIVGTRSYGKGTINQTRKLTSCDNPEGCGALYLSVGRWLRASKDEIEGIGVFPDIEVPLTVGIYEEYGDVQLLAAIDFLRGIPIVEISSGVTKVGSIVALNEGDLVLTETQVFLVVNGQLIEIPFQIIDPTSIVIEGGLVEVDGKYYESSTGVLTPLN